MKKCFLLFIVALMGLVSSCGNSSDSGAKITMTTVSDNVEIEIGGTGIAIITWEKEITETVRLGEDDEWEWVKCRYRYSDERPRTITINGGNITELDCSFSDMISLDVRRNIELEILDCSNNVLTNLDLSNNTNLIELNCGSNRLTNLDLHKSTFLITLNCRENRLTKLDLSTNVALKDLDCTFNELTGLNLSKNIALKYLSCGYNKIKALDLSQNHELIFLLCTNNELNADALDQLFGSLFETDEGGQQLYISENPGLSSCEPMIAENKGWYIRDL